MIIASLASEVRQKPQLVIHFLTSLIVVLTLFSVTRFISSLGLLPFQLSPSTATRTTLVLISSGLIFSTITYTSAWIRLTERIKLELPGGIEDYFKSFPESFEEIIDTTIWDHLNIRKLLPSIAVFSISYYGIWIFLLMLIDVSLFTTTGFSYVNALLKHSFTVFSVLIVSVTLLSLTIDIWPTSIYTKSSLNEEPPSNIIEYMRYFFNNVLFNPRRSKKYTRVPRWLLETIGKIITPIPYIKTKIILVDFLHIPLDIKTNVIKRKFNELLSASNGKYRLEALKESCEDITKIAPVKVPLLSSACWYKALKEGRVIGYIAVFRLIVEKFPYIITTKKPSVFKEHHLAIIMFGTEEIVELKYILLK